MKKIPSLFQRNYDGDRQVRNELVPGSEWVANGEGLATRKWDGQDQIRRLRHQTRPKLNITDAGMSASGLCRQVRKYLKALLSV